MKRLFLLPALLLALPACDPASLAGKMHRSKPPVTSCDSYSGPGCKFDKSPLRVLPEPVVLPKRAYTFFPTAERLQFVDAAGKTWVAPDRTLTDGASIPKIFVSIVGDPTSPEFINAAAVHDAYCGIGNETGSMYHQARWEDVHKMFYDGLVVGGAEPLTAKLMFAAVWMGGPRWDTARTLAHVPVAERQQGMRRAKAFIQAQNPTLDELLQYLQREETRLLSQFPRFRASPDAPESSSHEEIQEEEPYDPSTGL
ncbi:DUF1353 domain-containing protein [Tropicibacter oceani]|uniref:DUF1353 domain-containing protein n=1 Tax=Tropicibacter oceani TaxID=3058420 RepID=A0ABY8QGB2_9RHOB|nr:DUF1353 domain-containing protein [Tropicibacter oceani]WGW03671.1 DUF1353 domain-containing protein [Tropicibacter oceani]